MIGKPTLNTKRPPKELRDDGRRYWKAAVQTFETYGYRWTQGDLVQLLRICELVDFEADALEEMRSGGLIQKSEKGPAPAAALKVLRELTGMRHSFERGLQLTRQTRKTRDVQPKAEPGLADKKTKTGKVVELMTRARGK